MLSLADFGDNIDLVELSDFGDLASELLFRGDLDVSFGDELRRLLDDGLLCRRDFLRSAIE